MENRAEKRIAVWPKLFVQRGRPNERVIDIGCGPGAVEGDAWTDLPQQSFDVVILSNVLEHLDRREEFLRRIVERIAPQRLLIRQESFEAETQSAGLSVAHLQTNWGEIWAEVVPRPSPADLEGSQGVTWSVPCDGGCPD